MLLPSKTHNLISVAVRYVSTNNAKRSTVTTNEAKEIYYQKIGSQVNQVDSDVRAEGWEKAKPFEEVPGPKAYPLIGNFWRFLPVVGDYYKVQLSDIHHRLRKDFGDIVYLGGIPGKRPVVFAYDPDDMETLFRNDGPWPIRYGLPSFVYYRTHTRKDVFQGVGGLITVHGEDWFNIRSLSNKILMQPRTAEMFVENMDGVANSLIDNIRYFSKNNPKNEMPDTFQNELFKWTLESMGVIVYNTRIGCLDRDQDVNSEGQRMINSVIEVFELMFKLDILPSLWTMISTKDWRRYVKLLDYLTEVNQKYIKLSMANCNPDPNIPDHERSILERLAKDDKKMAVAMVTDMIIAGVDTTGKTMASALYFLARNPDKQQKLREEVKKYMPTKNSPVTKEMFRETPYLKAVIKESTRLAPTAVGSLRTTTRDIVLSGYQIPKGTDVLACNIVPSLDDKYYIKAKEFIPERWLRTTTDEYSYKNVNPFVSLPFGFGPRACSGKRLANLELEVGLSKVVRNFKLSWHYPDAKFGCKLLYGVTDPLRIKMEEINEI